MPIKCWQLIVGDSIGNDVYCCQDGGLMEDQPYLSFGTNLLLKELII